MATVKIILDKRTNRADGTYSINYQICHKRKTTTRSAKIYVSENDWDDETKSVRKSNPLHKTLNLKLKKDLADLQSNLLLADETKIQHYLKPELKVVPEPEEQVTVYQFADKLIKQLKADNKIGNAWVYESTVNALKGYHPDLNLYFENVDYKFLTQYNSFLIKRGIKPNSVYLYIRTIRIFFNKAIKLKVVDKALYPFDDFKLRPEKTRKRAVQLEVIKEINRLDLPIGKPIWNNRNYFMLSFYLIGISIIDLCLLTTDNIKNGRVSYRRRKTGKWYDIKLHPEAEAIINYYRGPSRYLIPIADEKANNDERLVRSIKYKTKHINKYLALIAKKLATDQTVTTYTARHSWATLAKKAGFSIEIIAEALGHEYGNRTTAVYLDNFDQCVIDEANYKVISLVK